MIRNGVSLPQLRELFPYLTDQPDPAFIDIIKQVKLLDPIVPQTLRWKSLPRLKASNNWVIAGSRAKSGKPILCGDAHLDSARLPGIWHEVRLRSNDLWFAGCTIPGIPLPALGRTDSLAWSPTYGYMDVIDFFVEEVKDGRYRRGEGWRDFEVRAETIKLKKGEPWRVLFYENEHGTLEGDPSEDGYYLSMAFTLGKGRGAASLNSGVALLTSQTVGEALPLFAEVDFCSQNWVCADRKGNIGYHQSGRCPVRAEGGSGLLPVPGWDPAFDWKGTYPVDCNPSLFNPPEGYIGTANQDINYCAKTRVCNLPMGDWRARRIHELLGERDDHTIASMQEMHYNLCSKQGEDWMPLIRPLLPEGQAADLPRNWDLCYGSDSIAASVVKNVYTEFARMVFGEQSLGEDVISHLMEETIIFCDFTGLFDQVMRQWESLRFGDKNRDDLLGEAARRGLAQDARPRGEGRKVIMNNIMFGGRLPKWLGFDYGPIEIIGNRATIP